MQPRAIIEPLTIRAITPHANTVSPPEDEEGVPATENNKEEEDEEGESAGYEVEALLLHKLGGPE